MRSGHANHPAGGPLLDEVVRYGAPQMLAAANRR
jgi:hypothetical protein